MRKRDHNALREYLRDLADALELRDWTVALAVGDPSGPARADGHRWGASSESIPGRKHVTVTFPPDVRDWEPNELRVTACHELIHAHLAPLSEMWRVDLYQHVARPTYELFNDGATRWLEYAVDALADATARHQPLIEWPS
jgi:hypothetical protein